MLKLRSASSVIFIYLFILQLSAIQCRPHIQRIIIRGHEWTVPNQPGWEDLVRKADSIRHELLSNCATSRDCRLAAEKLRQVFLEHPVSAKSYEDFIENNDIDKDEFSIFKWG